MFVYGPKTIFIALFFPISATVALLDAYFRNRISAVKPSFQIKILGGERFYRMDFPNFCDHIRGFAGFDNSYMLDPDF